AAAVPAADLADRYLDHFGQERWRVKPAHTGRFVDQSQAAPELRFVDHHQLPTFEVALQLLFQRLGIGLVAADQQRSLAVGPRGKLAAMLGDEGRRFGPRHARQRASKGYPLPCESLGWVVGGG